MNSLSETDKAYLAGFIDGDGCIMVSHKKGTNSYAADVGVYQSDGKILFYLKDRWGAGNIYEHKQKRGRSYFRWNISNSQGAKLLEEILPYLRIKKLQAEGVIELERSKGRPGVRLSESDLEYREWIKQRISDLNQGVLCGGDYAS